MAVPYGKLHYREMERQKTESLKNSYGNFEQLIALSTTSLTEIPWWKDNLMDSFAPIMRCNPELEISTDASTKGWGASNDGNHTGGEFDTGEKNFHINV